MVELRTLWASAVSPLERYVAEYNIFHNQSVVQGSNRGLWPEEEFR